MRGRRWPRYNFARLPTEVFVKQNENRAWFHVRVTRIQMLWRELRFLRHSLLSQPFRLLESGISFKQEPVIGVGSLSSDVFERRTSTGSEVFSLLTCLDDIKFVFLSFFTVIEAIWLKICAKPPSKNEKRPLPVDVRRWKTLLLKLPSEWDEGCQLFFVRRGQSIVINNNR